MTMKLSETIRTFRSEERLKPPVIQRPAVGNISHGGLPSIYCLPFLIAPQTSSGRATVQMRDR